MKYYSYIYLASFFDKWYTFTPQQGWLVSHTRKWADVVLLVHVVKENTGQSRIVLSPFTIAVTSVAVKSSTLANFVLKKLFLHTSRAARKMFHILSAKLPKHVFVGVNRESTELLQKTLSNISSVRRWLFGRWQFKAVWPKFLWLYHIDVLPHSS